MHASTVLTILGNDPHSCIILRSYVFSEVFTMCIGVMVPNISSEEVAMKLAVTGTLVKQCLPVYHSITVTHQPRAGMLKDHLIGERVIADYALFVLNQQQKFK